MENERLVIGHEFAAAEAGDKQLLFPYPAEPNPTTQAIPASLRLLRAIDHLEAENS